MGRLVFPCAKEVRGSGSGEEMSGWADEEVSSFSIQSPALIPSVCVTLFQPHLYICLCSLNLFSSFSVSFHLFVSLEPFL